MQRLFKETTKANVLQGQYWDEFQYASLLTKYRMNMDDYDDQQTVEWIVLFLKTNGALDATKLLNGVVNKQTREINTALFKYIPWYLGYRAEDFNRIISVPYDPEESDVPLNMVAAQLELEVEKYKSKGYDKKLRHFSSSKKEEKPKDKTEEFIESLFGIEPKINKEKESSDFIEYGIPQWELSLSSQLFGPCLGIQNEVYDALKESKYDNPLHPEYTRYCGFNSVTVVMLATLFAMYIIQDYFKVPHRSDRLRIDTDKNIQMVKDEIKAALDFEKRISDFWRAESRDSHYSPWEYENYNTIQHSKEILDRSKVVLKPVYDDFEEDEHNDLGHFPGASLF